MWPRLGSSTNRCVTDWLNVDVPPKSLLPDTLHVFFSSLSLSSWPLTQFLSWASSHSFSFSSLSFSRSLRSLSIFSRSSLLSLSSFFSMRVWSCCGSDCWLWQLLPSLMPLVLLRLDVSLFYDVSKLSEIWPCSCIHHTLIYDLLQEVLIGGVSFLFHFCTWNFKKTTRACVYPRVTQLCQKDLEKTCTEHLCYVMVLQASSQNIHSNARLVFGHYGGYHSPPCVFSIPPTSSRITTFTGILKLEFVMLAYYVLPKSSRDIFHTVYLSQHE